MCVSVVMCVHGALDLQLLPIEHDRLDTRHTHTRNEPMATSHAMLYCDQYTTQQFAILMRHGHGQ